MLKKPFVLLVFVMSSIVVPAMAAGVKVRVSTFNVSMFRESEGDLARDLATPDDHQGMAVAEILQRVRPDIVLLNEFDYDPDGRGLRLFRDNYLAVGQDTQGLDDPADPIAYPFTYIAPSNTGVPSGGDLDHDGRTDGPADCYGYGRYPGQYGMAILSRFPIRRESIRTFQKFSWRSMPKARRPIDPETGRRWYADLSDEDLRLSSKSHWDVPIEIDGRLVHVLVSHPTPPGFDGPEDRNGTRNHDEIRLVHDLATGSRRDGGRADDYLVDDRGGRGGLSADAAFVILGDLNSDPIDSDATGVRMLLDDPAIQGSSTDPAVTPTSAGGPEQARLQGKSNRKHQGDARFDTADFSDDRGPGNIRVDYVLPSIGLTLEGSGVFWPTSDDPLFGLVGSYDPDRPGNGFPASDHRLVWIDLIVVD